ncbi:MAG: glycosyltransferase family 2 protein [Chloroflexi bacterium]|nr:glycosyltransferase family 2 protein [Chloroflexota bacterium]
MDAIYSQTFPRAEMEVIVADGLSTDRTREEIGAFRAEHGDLAVQVVDNPRRNIPAALNRALSAACGQYVVRLDAHSAPHPDYVALCVQALEERQGTNVGGVWEIRPGGQGGVARAIAAAAAHPLGVGDALYRLSTQAAVVDTVPFGAFPRLLIDQIGPFDETLLTNEDYEFNTRIRRSGGKVWLDPSIRSVYYARSNLQELARQYWRYGYWKLRMLKRYPSSVRWRQALPPLFILSLIGLGLLSIFWPPARLGLAGEVILYCGILLAAGLIEAARRSDPFLAIGLPLGIATMHFSWGAGFLWSLLQPAPQK